MSSVIVPCPHCTGTARIDSATLPDRPAFFACPHCGKKVPVDKRKLMEVTPPEPEPAHEIPTLPEGADFSPGIVVGEDAAVVGELRHAMASVGGELSEMGSAPEAAEHIANEQIQLCVYVAKSAGTAPHDALAPFAALAPSVRRHLYLVLVAGDVKTLDGTTAFLHGVNLVVARSDVEKFAAVLHSGIEFHNRLYDPFFLAETVAAG